MEEQKKCYNCNVIIPNIYELCYTCAFDPDIVINKTQVKKKYKLTDSDLYNSNLFVLEYKSGYGSYCYKYLLKEVHELSKEITKDLDYKNPKKKSFLKQVNIMDDIKKKLEEKEKRYQEIENALVIFMEKLEYRDIINIDEYYKNIRENADNLDISLTVAINKIFKKIEKDHCRIKKFSDIINEDNRKDISKINTFNDYIYGYTDKQYYDIIDDIKKQLCRYDRINKINKYIIDNYSNNNDKKLLFQYRGRSSYINNNMKYEKCIDLMKKYIKKKNKENLKKNKKIDKNI